MILKGPRSRSALSKMTRMPREFAAAARAAGVPVNVIDKPAFCDFAFGAIVNRSPLVIGISTDGAAPVFAQAIRAKLEALMPKGFARLGRGGGALARGGQGVRPVVRRPAQFWQLFTAHAVRQSRTASRARATSTRWWPRCEDLARRWRTAR